jgi:hypothetical protein
MRWAVCSVTVALASISFVGPTASAAPTFYTPFTCGQSGWYASTSVGHLPANGNDYEIDFNMAGEDRGQPVLASADGTVSLPAYKPSGSNPLAIDHDCGGWLT